MTRTLPTIVLVLGLLPAAAADAAAQAAPSSAAGAPAAPASSALEPQGFTYDAAGRRDPFVSLVRRGATLARDPASPRPAGLPGLLTSEVTLSGILASAGGYVGMLEGADNKTYIVHPGDELLDGTIRAITADAIVILQQVNDDPLSPVTEREVRKVLRGETEEAN